MGAAILLACRGGTGVVFDIILFSALFELSMGWDLEYRRAHRNGNLHGDSSWYIYGFDIMSSTVGISTFWQ